MTMLQAGLVPSTGGGYQIQRSLRFNSADTAYLNRTPGSAGNRRIFTFSAWIKRSQANALVGIMGAGVNADSTQTDFVGFDGTNGNSLLANFGDGTYPVTTAAVLRDFSAWYHVVFAIDTTQATNTNRVKIYLNGIQQTLSGTYPPQNYDSAFNTTNFHTIGSRSRLGAASNYLNGYLTEVNFVDGQALTPSSFGETDSATGVWKPKAYSSTYGTNGFYLKFADNSGTTSTTLGKDSSGNGNNWTPNLFSVTAGAGNDSMVDSPTAYGTDTGVGGEVRGNYCTLNPLDKTAAATLSNGNLQALLNGINYFAKSTIAISSGKWYWEVTASATAEDMIGITKADVVTTGYFGSQATSYGYYKTNGNKYNSATGTAYGASYASGDIIGVALDLDAGTLTYYKNGVSQGTAFTGLSGTFFAGVSTAGTGGTQTINFGQRPFEKWNGSAYVANTAPSGFKALCTTNLPTPTIGATSTTQANKYMDVTLYTGNATARSITNSGFMQPDFVWDKLRSGANSHRLFDAVRGVEKALYSNLTNIEATETGTLTAFNSNGFSLGTNNETNTNGSTYVAWQWNAGGSNQTISVGQYATSPANVPSIASTVRANTTSGFSIVTFTTNNTAGATVGHGCQVGGVATTPDMIIMKYRGLAANWVVYHKSMNATPQNGYLNLNTTAGYAALIDPWNNTAPSSTVITMGAGAGSAGSTNYSVYTSVAYCFAAVAGYSAFGSYTGNGAADGPFVYTGFRPRYVMIKSSSNATNWFVIDTARDTYNQSGSVLWPNLANSEDNGGADISPMDFLSNGFKMRSASADTNINNYTYIYACFAENPFKYSLAR